MKSSIPIPQKSSPLRPLHPLLLKAPHGDGGSVGALKNISIGNSLGGSTR